MQPANIVGQTQMYSRLAHPTPRHFVDALGEDITVPEKTQKTGRVTGAKFPIFLSLKLLKFEINAYKSCIIFYKIFHRLDAT